MDGMWACEQQGGQLGTPATRPEASVLTGLAACLPPPPISGLGVITAFSATFPHL